MALFVSVPVCFSGTFGNDTAWDHHNSAPFLQPTHKLIAVIAFISQYKFALSDQKVPTESAPYRYRCGSRWRVKSAMDSPAPPPHGLSWSILLCCSRFPRDTPFLAPLACWWALIVVLSSIRCRFIYHVLLNQGKRTLSHTPAHDCFFLAGPFGAFSRGEEGLDFIPLSFTDFMYSILSLLPFARNSRVLKQTLGNLCVRSALPSRYCIRCPDPIQV